MRTHRIDSRLALFGMAILLTLSLPASHYAQQEPTPAPKPAQRPEPKPTPEKSPGDVVRITVQLVQIDAVVTDKKGEFVDSLTQDDFQLEVDGKPQPLTYFNLFKLPEPAATKPEKGEKTKSSPGLISMPTKTLEPEQIRRTIAFVVDDLGLSFQSIYYARKAIKKFVDDQMQEGDLVGIVRTGRGAGIFQQFTGDKRILYAAIEKLSWNPFSRDMIPHFTQPGDDLPASSQATGDDRQDRTNNGSDQLEDFRERVFSVGTLGALNFIVRGLRELPGRKTAILISDGFRLFGRNRDNTYVLDQVRRLTDLANRSSVVIYSLDGKGLHVLGPSAADSGGGNLTGPQFAERLSQMSQANFDSQEGLNYLARETGGFAVFNNNDLNAGIQKALKDQQSYYLLGFDPKDVKFDQKYHSLKLKVSRPGLNVRTRAGFLGRADQPKTERPKTPQAQILAALFSPFGARDLTIQTTSFFFNVNTPRTVHREMGGVGHREAAGPLNTAPVSTSFIRSLVYIDPANLTFKDGPNGVKIAKVELASFTFNENGVVIEQHGHNFTLTLTAEKYRLAMSRGLSHVDDLEIKKPGAYQFRAVIRDAETGKLGSAGQFVQVPDLKKKQLALSGLVLAAPASEFNADLPPGVLPLPGVRRFLRNSTIEYTGVVYNPAPDPKTGKPQLTLTVELFRDGKAIYQSSPRPIEPGIENKAKRLSFGGALKLTGLEPGDYLLHVIVEDLRAKKKNARADQWMDFSVR